MNKKTVHQAITDALLQRYETAKWAANQAHEAATNEESVAENKYDTFGLEASYLAHGQSQRVVECEKDWLVFDRKQLVDFNEEDAVDLWCLIELKEVNSLNEDVKYYYLSPCAGGLSVEVAGQKVYLVTPSSPVGKMLLGKYVDDEVQLLQNGIQMDHEIITIK